MVANVTRVIAVITLALLITPAVVICDEDRPSLREVGFSLYRDGKYAEAEAVFMAAYQFELPRLEKSGASTEKTERSLRLGRAMCYDRMSLWHEALRLYLAVSPDGQGRKHRLKPISRIEHRIVQIYRQAGQIKVLRELLDTHDAERIRAFKATPADARMVGSESELLETLPYRLLRKLTFAEPPEVPSDKTKAFLDGMPEVPDTVKLPAVLWTHPDVSLRLVLDSGYFEFSFESVKNHFADKAIAGNADDYQRYHVIVSALSDAKNEDPEATTVEIESSQEVTHHMVGLLLNATTKYYSNKTSQKYEIKQLKHVHDSSDIMKRHMLVAPSGEKLKFYFPRSAITVVKD